MAGFISDSIREQIRAANDIVDVIGAVLPLKRAGMNWVALCPFHKEKSPSFNVNPHKQIFHCFGCHKGGDVFTFVKEYEGLTFVEALRRLAERAKIPLEFNEGPGAQESRHVKDALLRLHEQITLRWQGALTNHPGGRIARDYLTQRGVSDEAVKLFRLGYAPDEWEDTVNWARSQRHPLELVEKAGLIIKKEGGGYYDRFRGRLMFPICDEQGRVIAFSGRVLSGDEKTAKYVNSPETDIFTKSKVFFGLDKSRRAILDAGFAVVCEGQLDLIACFMAGTQNVVAPQGTAFTAEHARILKRYANEVVLCFDSDNAGQAAAVRVLDSLLESGLAIRVAALPASHDPDSYIKQFGGPAFQQLIQSAGGFFDYYLHRLCLTNDLATDKGRLAVLRDMAAALHKAGNVVLIDTYARRTALRLGVSPESVLAEFKKSGRIPSHRGTQEDALRGEAASGARRPGPREDQLLKILLTHLDLLDWTAAHLDLHWIQHDDARVVVGRLLERHNGSHDFNPFSVVSDEDAATLRGLVTEALAGGRDLPNPARQLEDIARALRDQFLKRRIEDITRMLTSGEITEAERISLLREQQHLRQQRRQPLTPRADA